MGTWEGTFTNRNGTASNKLTINNDGTFVAALGDNTHRGAVSVADGKLRFRTTTSTTSPTSSAALYEDEGKRVLRGACDDGNCSFELRPTK